MMRYLHLSAFLALYLTGCGTQSGTEPAQLPGASNPPTTSPVSVTQSNLAPSMSDGQILRAIGLDPAALRSHRENGPDGYSIVYTNATTVVFITRSLVSGVCVIRLMPLAQKQEWTLGKP
jgi:hypothetical protein